MTANKNLSQKLSAVAVKYAKQEAAGNEQVRDAVIWGARWWNRMSGKPMATYEKEIREAIEQRRNKVEPWLKLQISKTARLWQLRDRLAAELDEETTLMRSGLGSTKQFIENIDPRLTSLEKLERTLTADLTALGLNYNTTVSKMKESGSDELEEDDPMARYYRSKLQ